MTYYIINHKELSEDEIINSWIKFIKINGLNINIYDFIHYGSFLTTTYYSVTPRLFEEMDFIKYIRFNGIIITEQGSEFYLNGYNVNFCDFLNELDDTQKTDILFDIDELR